MQQGSITAIHRAARFSPNSIAQDAAVMEAVCRLLRNDGFVVHEYVEDEVSFSDHSQVYLSMGRSARLLEMLAETEREGTLVVNSTAGVRLCCHRSRLEEKLREAGIALPEDNADSGAYWLKRGDGPSQTADDVVFAADKADVESKKQLFLQRGVSDIVVSPHVEGDLVKFYGVAGTPFFRVYYPTEDGYGKFGNEQRNGRPDYFRYSQDELHSAAELAAKTAGVVIYGGDAVVRRDGSFCMIDFNDWPSFSRCREDAAEAIIYRIKSLMNR